MELFELIDEMLQPCCTVMERNFGLFLISLMFLVYFLGVVPKHCTSVKVSRSDVAFQKPEFDSITTSSTLRESNNSSKCK